MLPDVFAKIPAVLLTVTDIGCIRTRIFNGSGFLNNIFEKNAFLTMHLFFMLFSLQFHETSTMVGLKTFHTVYKRTAL